MKPDHLLWFFGLCAVWVLIDGWRRRALGLGIFYGAASILLAPITIPIYLTRRPLKAGEVREGGVVWNILKNFVVVWTLLILVAALAGLFASGQALQKPMSQAEQAGAGLGIIVGLGLWAAAWFFPVLGALVFGLLLKKNSVVERGPTGPLAPRP